MDSETRTTSAAARVRETLAQVERTGMALKRRRAVGGPCEAVERALLEQRRELSRRRRRLLREEGCGEAA